MPDVIDIEFCLTAWHVTYGLGDLVKFLWQLLNKFGGLRWCTLSTMNVNMPHERLRGAKLHSDDIRSAFRHATAQEIDADKLGIGCHDSMIRDDLSRFLENIFLNLKVFCGSFDHEIDIVEATLHSLGVTYPWEHIFSFGLIYLLCSYLVVKILFDHGLTTLQLIAVDIDDLDLDVRKLTDGDQANARAKLTRTNHTNFLYLVDLKTKGSWR